ncbi:MAG: cupin domain-containing protein [Rhodocyclaceae bacterium]|nr:cupin domain-containing protein [Rhodocyclaceae bacterium]
MKKLPAMLAALALVCVLDAARADDAAKILRPENIAYQTDPNLPGVSFAVLAGSLKEGPYTLRARFAPGTRLPAHKHPDARTVTVLAGTYFFAEGERFDDAALVAYGPGTVIVVPAGRAHYAAARDVEAMVQESGTGPTATTPIAH